MGIFQTMMNRYKDSKQQSLNKEQFTQALLEAVSDSRLTKEEIDELEDMKSNLGLTQEDIDRIKIQVFATAVTVAKSDGRVTADEANELRHIQQFLGIADYEIQGTIQELARLRLLSEIQSGNIPRIQVADLIMQKVRLVTGQSQQC